MRQRTCRFKWTGTALLAASFTALGVAHAQETQKRASSYAPVDIKDDFATIMSRMVAAKLLGS